MMMQHVKDSIIESVSNFRLRRLQTFAINVEKTNFSALQLDELTSDEWGGVKELWGPLGIRMNPLFYQVYKTKVGFDPRFVSDDIYYPYIIRSLNPISYSEAFEHKGFYPFLFKGIPQPKMYVVCVRGVFYDENRCAISRNRAIEILKQRTPFILKPTHDSCCGRKVEKVSVGKAVEAAIASFGDDFIAQEVIRQSELTGRFNPSSINTFRISTLNINGVVSICTVIFRCGRGDVVVDNGGAGGLMVGVSQKGAFRDFAFDSKYNKYRQTATNVEFGRVIIPQVEEMCDAVKLWHAQYLPNLGFAGWDLALGADGRPVMIEVNLGFPGVQFEQAAPGSPIFGERTSEVIDFVVKHKPIFFRW